MAGVNPQSHLSEIRNQLNESSAAFWSDKEIYHLQWEAENLLASKIGLLQASTDHTSTTDTSEYTCPDDMVRIARVTYDGKKLKKVDRVDIDYLDGTSYGSTIDSGDPQVYWQWANNVTLYPTPDDTKTIRFEFYKMPSTIGTSTTDYSIRNPGIQHFIPDYVLWKGFLKDQEFSRADRHKEQWEENLKRAESIYSDEENEDAIRLVKDEDEYAGGVLGMD